MASAQSTTAWNTQFFQSIRPSPLKLKVLNVDTLKSLRNTKWVWNEYLHSNLAKAVGHAPEQQLQGSATMPLLNMLISSFHLSFAIAAICRPSSLLKFVTHYCRSNLYIDLFLLHFCWDSKQINLQAIMGSLIKTSWAAEHGLHPKSVYHCSVMPCYDKKLEASRDDFTQPGIPAYHVRLQSSVFTEMWPWF